MRLASILATAGLLLVAAVSSAEAPKVGDKVWAQWRPNQWYHGTLDKKTDVGFNVKFDDGDEADVAPSLLAADTAPAKDALKPGMRIIFPINDEICQLATVLKVADGKVECKLEDLSDSTVELKDVRVVNCAPAEDKTAKVGDVVWAQWRPNDWYKGKVGKKIDTGLHIEFDDGDIADLPVTAVVLDKAPAKDAVKAGKRVLAIFTDGKFYPATVTGDGADGKFKVHFDDGADAEAGLDDLRFMNE